jgi:hypothetical protein
MQLDTQESIMQKPVLAAALLAGAMALPIAAGAQTVIYGQSTTQGTITGSAPESSQRQADIVDRQTGQVIGGITLEQRGHFRSYVEEERTPSYAVPGEIRVGTTLPDVGVTYYDVPERFGDTTYRYTVIKDRTVLVDPRTRRVVQVIE